MYRNLKAWSALKQNTNESDAKEHQTLNSPRNVKLENTVMSIYHLDSLIYAIKMSKDLSMFYITKAYRTIVWKPPNHVLRHLQINLSEHISNYSTIRWNLLVYFYRY